MTEDGGLVAARRPSIATIFNPRRMKGSGAGPGGQRPAKSPHPRPSVVITDEDASPQALTNGGGDVTDGEGTPFEEGPGGLGAHMRERTSIISERGLGINLGARGVGSRASSGSLNVAAVKTHPQIQHSHSTGVRHARSPSFTLGPSMPSADPDQGSRAGSDKTRPSGCRRLARALTSLTSRKMVAGVLVTVFVSAAWVGATHLFKDLFLRRYPPRPLHTFPPTTHVGEPPDVDLFTRGLDAPAPDGDASEVSTPPSNDTSSPQQSPDGVLSFFRFGFAPANEYVPYGRQPGAEAVFDAPLFTTWFCTAWTSLFFPLYLLCRSCSCRGRTTVGTSLKTVSSAFRDRGVTCSKLLSRCCLFSVLWVATHYMYIYSLRILDCTDVMALYSAHVAFVYLLAWVILHEQFVGVRIVAVIMCNTGIALLAYMDGITHSTTLAGVVLAAASAAGSAVYKVLFKKVVGDASFGQVSVFFSVIAVLTTLQLAPVVAALHLSGYELVQWHVLPWPHLVLAAALTLVANLLGNFGAAVTFETFITLGLVLAIPASAVLDVRWYRVRFEGMKLAGIVLNTCGFFLVLFPADWPQYLTWFLRLGRQRKRHQQRQPPEPIDYRTGLISRSHLRSASGLIR